MTFRRSVCLLLLLLLLAASLVQMPVAPPLPPPAILSPWSYADLRLLDPPDADLPSHDLVAVYLRQSGDQLQLRLDLLAGVGLLDYDLYLAIQAGPGGTRQLPFQAQPDLAWDTLLVIPSAGPLQAILPDGSPRPGVALSVFRDPVADAVYLSLHLPALLSRPPAPPLQLQVFLTSPGSSDVADQTLVFRSDGPPPAPANLLLAFWDAYPAYTPATALRRWDGAHTGPLGGRHGLYNLLRTAQAAGVPLALLDLKDPASLSALDYAGGLDLVKQMAQSGLLILPEPLSDPRYGPFDLPAASQQALLEAAKATGAAFDLPASGFLYLPPAVPPPQPGRSALFARLPLPDTLATALHPGTNTPPLFLSRWQGRTVIPIPDSLSPAGADDSSPQIAPDGVTLDWRRRLLFTALSAGRPGSTSENTFLWLGSDLPSSAWGDPQSARAAFQWLKAHPWVRFLDAAALLNAHPDQPATFPPPPDASVQLALSGPPADLLTALQASPANALTQAAWQAFQALYAPVYPAPPQLSALRQFYTGQVWSLLEAASWAAAPAPQASCTVDPNHDGRSECLLASGQFYAQFEIADASLTYLFATGSPAGIHQLIGPSSQFITGLSSPDTWQLAAGLSDSLSDTPSDKLSADPSVIPGAFAGPGAGFLPALDQGNLVFTQPAGNAVKTFRLTATGLQVAYRLPPGASYPAAQIPLALDPWRRFSLGWADLYQAKSTADGWTWQIQSGPRLSVQTSTTLTGGDFNQSRSFFSAAEDPNLDFPLAHFVPFPLAVLQVRLDAQTQIFLQLLPQP